MKFLTLLFAFSFLYAQEVPLPEGIQKIMHQEKYAHSIWGLYMEDLTTGEVPFNLNSQMLFAPGSTTKIVSTAALLHGLGEDFYFHTPVYAAGKIENGELKGDLILVGQGDLTLGGRQSSSNTISFTKMDHIVANVLPGAILTKEPPLRGIDSLARQVYESGIRKINGEIQIDDSLFETTEKRGMILSPIMLNENLIDIVLRPTNVNEPADMEFRPKVPGYSVENRVKTIVQPGAPMIDIKRENQKIVVQGTISLGEKEIVRTYQVQDPKAFARSAFIQALQNQGIQIALSGQAQKITSYQGLPRVAVWTSPPLAEYAKLILKVSHNLGANLIPLLLAAHKGEGRTFEDGMRMIGDFLAQDVKVSPDTFVMADAAGGNENRFTPQTIVQVLDYMHDQGFMPFKDYLEALPLLGVDGSMEDFAKNTPAVGRIWTKPGTGVVLNLATDKMFLITQALAGYIQGKNGHLFGYMLVVNNAKMPTMDDIYPIFEDQAQISNILYTLVPPNRTQE